jgi:eukaryotic-like serine/threonine-protein kinase
VTAETGILPARYRDPRKIGRGAMGDIYLAVDSALNRPVAVKVLADRYAEDGAIRNRFTREAHAAARLSGAPNVVTIFDVGAWRERPHFVMEYLEGGSLADMLANEGPQPPSRALPWLEQAARALDAAHALGVVHRDVKPANLLLDARGAVHVGDFGIASAAGMDSLTQTGTVLGTAGYLSPEQARGERATPASDRYAFGVVAWELFTGARPFETTTAAAEATAHVHGLVPSLCAQRPDLPCELDPVFERALAKDPRARYASAAEFVADLRAALDEAAGRTAIVWPAPVPASPPPARPAGRARRSWLWPAVLAVAGAAILGGVLGALFAGGSGGRGGQPRAVTVTRTVTTAGQAQTQTQTVQVTVPPATPPAASGPPSSGGSGAALNNRAWALMQRGDYAAALPLLEQAILKLDGTGSRDEAYADYNLAYTRLQLSRCDDVLALLDESQAIQGHRREIDEARRAAHRAC